MQRPLLVVAHDSIQSRTYRTPEKLSRDQTLQKVACGLGSTVVISPYRSLTLPGVLSVIAFHEKAGRSQVDSSVASLNKVFFSRRVATVAMLPSALSRSDWFRSVQVGRSRFSRRCHLFGALGSALAESNLGQAINAVTGTRLSALELRGPKPEIRSDRGGSGSY